MRRLLLADDDLELRSGVADLLGDLGLEIVHAETGLEALSVVRTGRVHAALLDWNMPACSGLEALAQILEIQRGLPCILYSGHLTPDMEGIALRAGAFSVMRKPVAPNVLRREVLRALEVYERLLRGPLDLN
jgi:two-component system nitrogen regulation response regulator NtrX